MMVAPNFIDMCASKSKFRSTKFREISCHSGDPSPAVSGGAQCLVHFLRQQDFHLLAKIDQLRQPQTCFRIAGSIGSHGFQSKALAAL